MKEFSSRAKNIMESQTVAITSKAIALKEAGENIISLGAGEPDFDTPKSICAAAQHAIDEGKTRYGNVSGIIELRKVIAEKISKENGVACSAENIVVSNGGKQAVSNALAAIIDKDDEVIIFSPYWVSYPTLVEYYGGKPVIIETTQKHGYKINIDDLQVAITDKTKAIIINSPCNPTGVVYNRDELMAIGKIVEENDLFVLSDEIYEKIVFDGVEHVSIASFSDKLRENTIIVNGFSKSYAMTGWRIGYSVCNVQLAKKIASIQSQVTHHNCSLSQYAAFEALTNVEVQDEVELMRLQYQHRQKLICRELDKIENVSYVLPDGAFYIFLDISNYYTNEIPNSLKMIDYILETAKVVTMPGDAFGSETTIRLSYATSDANIVKAIGAIKNSLLKLKS